MIALRFQRNEILIEGDTGESADVLLLPLHRLHFRSLNGTLEAAERRWRIPIAGDAENVIHSVLDHLTKYGLPYRLDEQCQSILDSRQERQQNFQELLSAGRTVKRKPITASVKANLVKSLLPEFSRPLTNLQLWAVHHLLAIENAANFSVPGSGKTSVVLACYHILRKTGVINAMLVIGPASCFDPWEQEFEKCFGRKPRSLRLAGNNRSRRRELLALSGKYELILTTYHSAARDVADLGGLLSRRPVMLILDESHYVKRPQGGILADAVLALSHHAKRRIILSGTPMPNSLADLWSQITFLWPTQLPLGSSDDYLQQIQQKDIRPVIRHVSSSISPLFFRTTKSQLKLPRPQFKILRCNMSPLQKRIYLGIAERFLAQVREAPRDRDALRQWRRARAIRLLQVASNPALLHKRCDDFSLPPLDLSNVNLGEAIEHYAKYEMPTKFSTACNLLRKICGTGRKAILWSSFVQNLNMLASELRNLNPVVIHGAVPYLSDDEDEFSREKMIHRFKNDSECRLLIANPAACAESISLHMVCHDAIYLDRSFNCAHYLQSLDRIHRLGLPEGTATAYYLLIATDSVDEVVHARLKDKLKNMRSVIEGDLPGQVPGYWSEDLGDEENVDHAQVEEHIRRLFSTRER